MNDVFNLFTEDEINEFNTIDADEEQSLQKKIAIIGVDRDSNYHELYDTAMKERTAIKK